MLCSGGFAGWFTRGLCAISLMAASLAGASAARSEGAAAGEPEEVSAGRAVAHDWYKGNCLACHQIPGDARAITLANIGPVLVDVRKRFPDRAALRRRIWDPTVSNPDTVMPPFGKHRILSEKEIDLVVEYIYRY
jgi:L-cysteine S-thiosulfotransferase